MMSTPASLGITVQLKTDFNTAVVKVVEELKVEGFGVLTEIDVKETLKKKLDVDSRPYKILGVCNPPLAYRALSIAPEVGLLLPCNVTVSQVAENTVEVSLIDPLSMMSVITHPDMASVAQEARTKLERVAIALQK